mmetsp:Transcript_8541/g.14403  ORF Transcript_8541/g.14403 Transcript_8541/m.14403 type:complete len:94 (-) Transcript_8541:633-914(-)
MTFPNRDQQRKHIKRKHEQKIRCQICLDQALQDLKLKKISKKEFEVREREELTFNKRNQLRKHELDQHDKGWIVCKCGCQKKFTSQKLMDSHL